MTSCLWRVVQTKSIHGVRRPAIPRGASTTSTTWLVSQTGLRSQKKVFIALYYKYSLFRLVHQARRERKPREKN